MLHALDIRARYVLDILHQILLLILQFCIQNHQHKNPLTNDFGVALAEILRKNLGKFKRRKEIHKHDYYTAYFYDDPGTNQQLKARIPIETLDITILAKLINLDFMISEIRKRSRCCNQCSQQHKKCTCGNIQCNNRACKLEPCQDINCNNAQNCKFIAFKRFIGLVQGLRNCFAHLNDHTFLDDLQNGLQHLQDFPNLAWDALMGEIVTASLEPLDFLRKYRAPNSMNTFITDHQFKCFEMELYISVFKDTDFLLPAVANKVKHFQNVVLGAEDIDENIEKKFKSSLNDFKNSLDTLTVNWDELRTHLNKDCVQYKGTVINYNDANLKKESFDVSINVSGGCTLIFKKSYNLINIQLRKSSKQWNDLSPNIKVTVGTHHNLVIVDKLKLGSFYEFRAICLNQAGEVVIFKTKEDLQIKEIKEEDKLVVYGQNYVIQDFENLRADVIYVDYESIHFIFDKESDISEVIKVEIRSGDEKWDLVDENCYEFGDQLLDGAKNLMVGKLEENESYDMRITVRKFDDGVVVYIRKAIVTDESHSLSMYNLVSVKTHPLGYSEDSYQKNVLANKKKVIRFQTGAGQEKRSLQSIDSAKYVNNNFPDEDIVLPYLNTMEPQSFRSVLAKKFMAIGEKLPGKFYLLSSFNARKHLEKTLGVKKKFIEEQFRYLSLDGNLMIFYPPSYPAVVLVTLPGSERESLHQLIFRADENLKSYLALHEDLFQVKRFAIINVFAAVHHQREDVEKSLHCQDSLPFMLFSDFVYDSQTWWDKIEEFLGKIANDLEESDQQSTFEISARSILLEALIDDNFPTLFAKDEEVFCKKIMNRAQIDVLLDKTQHKLVKGPYGSGKSVIVNESIQRSLEEKDITTVYLGYEEYSLLQVQMERFCQTIPGNIVCLNVADLTLERGSKNILPLRESLEMIESKFKGKRLHIILDEYDTEELNNKEAKKIRYLLEGRFFKNCQITIAVQSCQKKRIIQRENMKKEQSANCLDDLGMKEFELLKTMRYTSSICQSVSLSLKKVEEQEAVYDIPIKPTTNEFESRRKASIPMMLNMKSSEDQADEGTNVEMDTDRNSMEVPTPRIDELCQYSGKTGAKMISKFVYPKGVTSGVRRKGETPLLLQLEGLNIASLKMMVHLLNTFVSKNKRGKNKDKKLMLICNSKDLLPFVRCTLKVAGTKYIEYTDNIRGQPAKSTSDKEAILYSWENEVPVLLTDCRGCRGMENDEVLVLWDLSDIYGRQMFGEALSRSRTKLYIVSVKRHETSNAISIASSNLTEAVKLLVDHKHVEDKTDVCKSNSVEIPRSFFDEYKVLGNADESTYDMRAMLHQLVDQYEEPKQIQHISKIQAKQLRQRSISLYMRPKDKKEKSTDQDASQPWWLSCSTSGAGKINAPSRFEARRLSTRPTKEIDIYDIISDDKTDTPNYVRYPAPIIISDEGSEIPHDAQYHDQVLQMQHAPPASSNRVQFLKQESLVVNTSRPSYSSHGVNKSTSSSMLFDWGESNRPEKQHEQRNFENILQEFSDDAIHLNKITPTFYFD